MEISVTNAWPDIDTIHVLPHLWFRNTWAWDHGTTWPEMGAAAPRKVAVQHLRFGEVVREVDTGPDGSNPRRSVHDGLVNSRRARDNRSYAAARRASNRQSSMVVSTTIHDTTQAIVMAIIADRARRPTPAPSTSVAR
jgi:hypothetical protein